MELFADGSQANMRSADYLRLATVIERMPIGVGIYTRSGDLFYSNRLFGFRDSSRAPSVSAEVDRWHAYDSAGVRLTPDRYPCARAFGGEIAAPGIDIRFSDDTGEARWFSVAAIPLQSRSSPGVSGAVVITQDCDDRRKLATELAASELRFEQFAENSRNSLLITDPLSGRVHYASSSASAIFGWRAGSIEPGAWERALHPEDSEAALEHRRCSAAGVVQRFGYRVAGSGGRMRQLNETCFPIRHPGRAEMLVGSIVEDVSDEGRVNLYCVGALSCDIDALGAAAPETLAIKRFASLAAFSEVADVLAPGCLLIELSAPGDADIIARIAALAGERLAVVVLAPDELPTTLVRALLQVEGLQLLVPPFGTAQVDAAIRAATRRAPPPPQAPAPGEGAEALARLSKREGEVLDGLLNGGTNKTIARELGLSPRTVELHRARLMDRLKVRTLSELLRLTLSLKRLTR